MNGPASFLKRLAYVLAVVLTVVAFFAVGGMVTWGYMEFRDLGQRVEANRMESQLTDATLKAIQPIFQEGKARSDIQDELSRFAWGHYSCDDSPLWKDVYLYGSRDEDRMGILMLYYEESDGVQRFTQSTTMPNDRVKSITSGCTELDMLTESEE